MTTIGESSSPLPEPADSKLVVVRIKRKASQPALDAFWLEINERPLKRALVDFQNLSVSESSSSREESKTKVFVQHVETVRSSEATLDILQSFVEPKSSDTVETKAKSEERRRYFKQDNNKQDQRFAKARQEHEALAKNARFEQIWRSRRGTNDELNGTFRFYDVMRVDDDERQQPEDLSPEEQRALSSYLPLLREFIPDAAAEIESDIQLYISNQAMPDEYVYDFYTVKDDMDITEEDALHPFPLVHVDDEDFYGVCYESECETDDSNAEDNPRNEYPDESSEEEEDKSEKENSDTESEDGKSEGSRNQSSVPKDSEHFDQSDGEDQFYDGADYDGDDLDQDDEDWRWYYR